MAYDSYSSGYPHQRPQETSYYESSGYPHQRPQETTYYESKTEVIREPYDSYSSQQRKHNDAGGVVGQVVGAIVKNILPGSHGRHNNQHGEVIEKREERIYGSGYEPYPRGY